MSSAQLLQSQIGIPNNSSSTSLLHNYTPNLKRNFKKQVAIKTNKNHTLTSKDWNVAILLFWVTSFIQCIFEALLYPIITPEIQSYIKPKKSKLYIKNVSTNTEYTKHIYELIKQRSIPGLLGALKEIRGVKHIELDIIICVFLERICEVEQANDKGFNKSVLGLNNTEDKAIFYIL